jgi:pimeloyl-ACP methyl ester carboxylesterase
MTLHPRNVVLAAAVLFSCGITFVLIELICSRGVTPPIDAPRSIATLERVHLGAAEQWILVRGRDRDHPILLFLHGGPGMPAMYLAHAFQREIENDFVVVHWDRLGAGKSYAAGLDAAEISVSRALEETLELVRVLRSRFGRRKIFLVGHSWGSYLGLLAVRESPDDFHAFIGTGQLAGSREEADAVRVRLAVRAAKKSGEGELLRRLSGGEVSLSESDLFLLGGEIHAARSFWPLLATGIAAPEYTLRDVINVKRGADLVARRMRYDIEPRPLQGEVESVAVPVFLFLGRHDLNTPSQVAAEYLGRLDTPLERVVWFEESAHFPFLEEPRRFHEELLSVAREVERFGASVASRPDRTAARENRTGRR